MSAATIHTSRVKHEPSKMYGRSRMVEALFNDLKQYQASEGRAKLNGWNIAETDVVKHFLATILTTAASAGLSPLQAIEEALLDFALDQSTADQTKYLEAHRAIKGLLDRGPVNYVNRGQVNRKA